MADIRKEFQRYKRGILIGALVGFAAANYVKIKGVDFMFAVQSQGLLDRMASASSPETVAFYKVALVFVVLGIFVGYIIEKNVIK